MSIQASRYELLAKIASGGMGTVYVGRQRGAAGFRRLVAIKRAHPHLLDDASFARMLINEAEMASSITHPNAVAVSDVEELDGELLLIMDYVHGVPLSKLINALDPEDDRPVPPRIALRIALDACAGLQACHEARDEDGNRLELVHRDVSPQNVLVGTDGQARLTDFGIAKSQVAEGLTHTGTIRGKVGYMAPEYAAEGRLDARSDVFGMGVVVWETLVGRRLFRGATDLETLKLITESDAPTASSQAPWLGDALDDALATALQRDPERRFASADAFANALEHAAREADMVGRHREVADLVGELFGDELDARQQRMQQSVQQSSRDGTASMTAPASEPLDLRNRTLAETDMAEVMSAPKEPSTLEASNLALSLEPPPTRRWLAAGAALVAVAIGVYALSDSGGDSGGDSGADETAAVDAANAASNSNAASAAPAAPSPTPSATDTPDVSDDPPNSDVTASATPTPPPETPKPTATPVPQPVPAHKPAPRPTPKSSPKPGMSAAPDPYATGRPAPDNPYQREP